MSRANLTQDLIDDLRKKGSLTSADLFSGRYGMNHTARVSNARDALFPEETITATFLESGLWEYRIERLNNGDE